LVDSTGRPAAVGGAPEALPSQALRPGGALTLIAQACLGHRPHTHACAACADACPAGVLTIAAGGPVLADGCLACGRCAAACPTGALAVRGFAASLPPDTAVFECARVPDATRVSGAGAVRCLGGLAVADLLDAAGRAAGPLILIDRSWCAGCPAGGSATHPATAAVAAAATVIVPLGLPAPRIERFPTPPHKARPLRPDADTVNPGRRRLFGGLLRATRADRDGPAHDLRAPLAMPGRRRTLAAAHTLAAAAGRPLPGSLHPMLRLADACRDHRVCAAVCPTRALHSVADGTAATLGFDTDACFACGRCAASCPEHAVTIASGSQWAPEARLVLRRAEIRACDECGDDFTAPTADDTGLCPACRKRISLMRDVLSASATRPRPHSNEGACE